MCIDIMSVRIAYTNLLYGSYQAFLWELKWSRGVFIDLLVFTTCVEEKGLWIWTLQRDIIHAGWMNLRPKKSFKRTRNL